MIVLNCVQRSPEWYAARLGVPSASNFDKIVTSKGECSKQWRKYLYQLAGEKACGIAEESYQSAAMTRGAEMEAEAKMFYELSTSQTVQEVGFCLSDCGRYGASPDGLVGEDGLIEIKCPTLSVHVEYLLGKKIPTDYVQQTQGQLLVTGREWIDFISYYPGVRPLIVRVRRDEDFIKSLESALVNFCESLKIVYEQIKQ
jgi:predicted phage-related endonuclease